jgi:hypothetical protein
MPGMPKRSSRKSAEAQNQENAVQSSSEPTDASASADPAPADGKNPAAVALGRLGGKKGGLARARKLTAEQRSESARKAAQARWVKKSK